MGWATPCVTGELVMVIFFFVFEYFACTAFDWTLKRSLIYQPNSEQVNRFASASFVVACFADNR